MKKSDIRELGDPILRLKAKNIKAGELSQPSFKKLLREMYSLMKRADGVGLAAPQIGKSIRLFVFSIPDENGISNKYAVINPKIVKKSKALMPSWEGCLSIPGFRGLVRRHKSISVVYSDEKGNIQRRQLRDFEAVVFQHEFDHLNGKLYIDRLVNDRSLFTEREFERRLAG